MYSVYFIIATASSVIGSISGIGGGIIIKPVMDAVTTLSPATISFMSGCTVLSMALCTYIRGLKSDIKLNYSTTFWLAAGACFGGYWGKLIFSSLSGNIKLVQSVTLLLINLLVFVYLRKKSSIKTKNTKNRPLCVLIGLGLGAVSSFLGIGGGPVNIVVLYYFFSMPAKQTAKNSLFIILFSQLTSFFTTIFTHTVPTFEPLALFLMCSGGVAGALAGAAIAKKMSNSATEEFFSILLVFLIALNIYNVVLAI